MEKTIDLLKQTREAKQISLKEAETATRIPLRYLRILEGEEESLLLPDKAYLVPFLRTYATFLGLEATTTVTQFLTELQQEAHAAELTPIEPLPQSPRLPTWAIPAFFFLVVVIVFALMPRDKDSRSQAPSAAEDEFNSSPFSELPRTPSATVPADSQVATLPAPPPMDDPQQSAPAASPPPPKAPASVSSPEATRPPQPSSPAGPHVLKIQATEPAWVRVIIDGKQQQDVLLQPGETTEWSAKNHFLLTLGNAGGVAITVDGKPLPSLGQPGEVIRDLRLPATSAEATNAARGLPSPGS